MQLILDYARAERLRIMEGQVLRENRTMLKMCEELGFAIDNVENIRNIVTVRWLLERTTKLCDKAGTILLNKSDAKGIQ